MVDNIHCMDIYLLRHGKAESPLSGVKSDAKRRLTVAGKREMEDIAAGIKDMNILFDHIISSPLVRAKETADILVKHYEKKKNILMWDELKPEFDILETHKQLAKFAPDSKILLVGHEPHLTDLVSSIISKTGVSINLKKGGFVSLRANVFGLRLVGSLKSLLTPKQLKQFTKRSY